MIFRGYILKLAAGSLFVAAAIIALNFFVDPYAIFGTQRIPGINMKKPFAGDQGHIAKAYQSLRVRPKTIIIGNSRPELGLDPENQCFATDESPVYNLALPGLSFMNQALYGLQSINAGTVTQAFVAVDFLDFIVPASATDGITSEIFPVQGGNALLRLSADEARSPAYLIEKTRNYALAMASLEALSASTLTILRQHAVFTEDRTELGYHPAENLFMPIIESEGLDVLFDQKHEELASRLRNQDWQLAPQGSEASQAMSALRHFLLSAKNAEIEVSVFINPYHAEYMAHVYLNDLWPLFEDWKSMILELGDGLDFAVYDFSLSDQRLYESRTSSDDQHQPLTWFWEPAHYRKELGDLMIEHMTDCGSANTSSSTRFGQRLRPDTLQTLMNAERVRFSGFLENNWALRDRILGYYDRD